MLFKLFLRNILFMIVFTHGLGLRGAADLRRYENEHMLRRVRRQTVAQCDTTNYFECDSGQCIPKDFKCDGPPHCQDKSDESNKHCRNIHCPEFNFKCANGACININRKCNGIKDCLDGSDEDRNTCQRTCPSIYSNKYMSVQCFYHSQHLENCIDPPDGTVARFACQDLFEFSTEARSDSSSTCKNGKWDKEIPHCIPTCGKKSVAAETLIISGRNISKGEYPWQIALYTSKGKILFCGGSLISQNIVLTAAHCVTKSSTSSLIPKEAIIVAAGKYYRNYSDPKDAEDAQFSNVKDILIPQEYRGDIQNYLGDLALLITEKSFILSKYVLPICVDWELKFERDFLGPNTVGVVTGWGWIHETDTPSEILKSLAVPYVNYQNCNLTFDYHQYLTHDKLCGGYINQSAAACKGDSGGPLAFPNKIDRKYYVVGIVSLSPRAPTSKGGCNSQNYGLYTRVSGYIHFMKNKVALHQTSDANCTLPEFPDNGYFNIHGHEMIRRPGIPLPNGTLIQVVCNRNYYNEGPQIILCKNGQWTSKVGACKSVFRSCILPDYPANGFWNLFGTTTDAFEPGMEVPSSTVLQIHCNPIYKLKGYDTVFCFNGTWNADIGSCEYSKRSCTTIKANKETTITCTYNGATLENCDDPRSGTVSTLQCKPYYEFSDLTQRRIIHCENGTWENLSGITPRCQPACGQRPKQASPLVRIGMANKLEVPWQAALYEKKLDNLLICGATLVNPNIVITAAHCVTNSNGSVKNVTNYVVSVGQYYRKYDDPRDIRAQRSEVKQILIPEEFRGSTLNYIGDIAIIVTEKEFQLNEFVLPICIDWNSNIEAILAKSPMMGIIAGWGLTKSNGTPSETLKQIPIAYINQEDCRNNLSEDFIRYYHSDKHCASELMRNGSVICRGDTGGATAFQYSEDRRYYLIGIASLRPVGKNREACNSGDPLLSTRIAYYLNFLGKDRQIEKYKYVPEARDSL